MNTNTKLQSAKKKIKDEIKKHNLNFVWQNIESPLKKICDEMTKNGFKIDLKKLKNLSTVFQKKILEIEKEIFKISGNEFNVKSTQQLSKVLFQELEISSKGLKKTPKGVISTKESELLKLKGQHKIIDLILEYRELAKMLSTYVDNIIPTVDSDNRIHPEFLQLGTSTGRMSSKNPNIQNIPAGGKYGSLIREVFIPKKDFLLVSFDYSQIELRIASLLSEDQKLIKAFRENQDIHSAVAEEIFGEETKETRRKAKIINFGILYGMGANSLKNNLNEGNNDEEIKIADARKYLDDYFEKFSGLASYIEKEKQRVKEDGFTTTLFGRKRFFPEINSKVPFIKAMAERMAINAPIQGSSADIIKIAMIKIDEFLEKENLKDNVKMLAQVHDELIFEIEKNTFEKVCKKIDEIMENILNNSDLEKKYKKVPLVVHINKGLNWSELK
ncbi:MAG: hypothetical protein KAI16_02520 [Candidatus Pacebacteria bacterium]|nr:hypothetical protein [Candidatus Paceibacterota bacterium]